MDEKSRISDRPAAGSPRLLELVSAAIRRRYYNRRTEQAYVHWIKRFTAFLNDLLTTYWLRPSGR